MRNWKLPACATLAYILAGAGWIIAGYFLSSALYENEPTAHFELLKGLAYVGVTAAVLFAVLTYLDRRNPENSIAGDLGAAFEQSLRRGDLVLRWLPALVMFICVTTVLILALGLWWVREHTLEAGTQSALSLQKAHAAQMNGALDIINFTLRETARDITAGRPGGDPADLNRNIPDLMSSVSSIAVTDASGKIIHNTDTDPRVASLDLSSRDYFLHHLNNPNSELHLSAPQQGMASGRWLLVASRAMRSVSGKFTGTVLAVIDPAIFGAYWRHTTAAGSTISIYQADGTLLLRSPYREDTIGRSNLHELPPVNQTGNADSQAFRARSKIDGEHRIYATGPVPGYPQLRLLVSLSQSRLLESWHAFALISLAVYLLVISGLTALTFGLLRQLRERLVLQRKAAELARYPLQNRSPVLTVTPDGRKLFMNHAAVQLIDAAKGGDTEKLERELRAMAAEQEPGQREITVGASLFAASFLPHNRDYCDVYLTDITGIRRDENLLRLFFDLPFIGMATSSPESKHWLRFNDRLCEILGYTREQLARVTWAAMTHPDDLAADVAEFDRVMRGEIEGYTLDKRFIRPDGAIVHTTIDVHASRRPDRSIECFVCTVQDITARKQADAALRESEARFKGLVEQSLVGIFIIDSTMVRYTNPRAAEILGRSQDEVIGRETSSFVHPDDVALVGQNIRRLLSGEQADLKMEFRGLHRDGSTVYIGAHGSLAEISGRQCIIGVMQDITDKREHDRRINEYVERLEHSIMSTVQAISHMVDLRDPYTAGHERRVGELAAAIGAEIGMNEHQIKGLRVAGSVHDVGKIGVPAEILSKPTRLSAAEFAIVKTHAQQGYEILKDIDFPWPIAQTVWQHHERLDGSGYPRGLRGDEISLEARIMAVADIIESMSTHRPYRPAMGIDAAFAELNAQPGKLYDQAIVTACERLFREKGYQLPE